MVRKPGILLLCGLLAGCSSPAPNLTGTWQVTLKSSVNGNTYTGTASITESSVPVNSTGAGSFERAVSGTMNLGNDPCAAAGAPVSGTITSPNVILTVTEAGQLALSLTGTVNGAFTAMSGDYSAQVGGCNSGDSGSWSANKP